jgi:hypothetical protein
MIQGSSEKPERIPWRSIAQACALTLFGFFTLIAGVVAFSLSDGDNRDWKSTRPFLFVIGAMAFVPGAYHLVIAVEAYRGTPGFSFAQIPHE